MSSVLICPERAMRLPLCVPHRTGLTIAIGRKRFWHHAPAIYKVNPDLLGELGESEAEGIFFQFIEVYTWKLLKGGTCVLLRL